jgi:hypothetical protein
MHFIVRIYGGLKSCTSLMENAVLVFVFLLAILGTSHCWAFVLLLGAPSLPTWRVKISNYLQSQRLLSITFIPICLKLLKIFVRNHNVVCYVILSYHVLISSLLRLLSTFSALICCLPPVLACNLSLILRCVCP